MNGLHVKTQPVPIGVCSQDTAGCRIMLALESLADMHGLNPSVRLVTGRGRNAFCVGFGSTLRFHLVGGEAPMSIWVAQALACAYSWGRECVDRYLRRRWSVDQTVRAARRFD